jgi:dTDP-glucose 4,6-dehydratase
MGSNMVRYVLRTYPEYTVVNLDKLTYAGNPENLRDRENDKRYSFIKGDITDAATVSRAATGVDAIINYAAETHVDRSIMDPAAFLRTDVMGTFTLLEQVRRQGIGRYIQISTDEVYGSVPEGETDEHAPFRPRSPYAASKAGGDHVCHAYRETYGAPVIVTHSANFIGPHQYPEKFVPLFITNLLEGKKVPVYGDGLNVREWIFTEDHCRAIDTILHNGKIGESYNIGTGERFTNIEIVKKILTHMKMDESMIEYVKDRPGHDKRYALNADKIRKELGWKPETSFDDALSKTVAWYTGNSQWWGKIKSGAFRDYYEKQYLIA